MHPLNASAAISWKPSKNVSKSTAERQAALARHAASQLGSFDVHRQQRLLQYLISAIFTRLSGRWNKADADGALRRQVVREQGNADEKGGTGARAMKLPRFRGHPTVWVFGVHNGKEAPTLRAGIPPADD